MAKRKPSEIIEDFRGARRLLGDCRGDEPVVTYRDGAYHYFDPQSGPTRTTLDGLERRAQMYRRIMAQPVEFPAALHPQRLEHLAAKGAK